MLRSSRRMSGSVAVALVALVVLGYQNVAMAFYLAGVNPYSFSEGEDVLLKVDKVTSTKTLFPHDYYSFPFCRPDGGIRRDKQNIGGTLSGNIVSSSPYVLRMKTDMYCEQVCYSTLGRGNRNGADKGELHPNKVTRAISQRYHNNWIVDNLPAASRMETDRKITTRYWQGFPIGFVSHDGSKVYIHNHVNIEIMYHEVETQPAKYRVVRFTVEPFSIQHDFEPIIPTVDLESDKILPIKAVIKNPIESCIPTNRGDKKHTNYAMVANARRPQLASGPVLFTYDVMWVENTDLLWASRWDVYLTLDHAVPASVHWLSIANSCIVLAGLLVLIVVIRLRNLRHDELDGYLDPLSPDDEEARAQELEEKGWKLIYLEAFDPPEFPLFWSVCCGTGAQLLATALPIIFFASLGFMSAARRGMLVVNTLVVFVAMGVVNGYVTARFYKMFGGEGSPTLMAALFFPGVTFVAFLIMNILALIVKSTYAVPFVTWVVLVVLWLGFCAPLVSLGEFLGSKKEVIRLPKQPGSILIGILTRRYLRTMSRRTLLCVVLVGLLFNVFTITFLLLWAVRHYLVKRNCWSPKWSGTFMLLMGGILSFGALFVELYYLLASAWMEYYYHSYGFLLMVFFIVLVTSAEVAVIFGYLQLSMDGYFSWWWQFSYAGALSIWVFFYSSIYYQQLEGLQSLSTFLLYFGFMAWVSLGLSLMTGFVGVAVSIWFVQKMFSVALSGERRSHDEIGDYVAVELAAGDEQPTALLTDGSHDDGSFADRHEQDSRDEVACGLEPVAAAPNGNDSLHPDAHENPNGE